MITPDPDLFGDFDPDMDLKTSAAQMLDEEDVCVDAHSRFGSKRTQIHSVASVLADDTKVDEIGNHISAFTRTCDVRCRTVRKRTLAL